MIQDDEQPDIWEAPVPKKAAVIAIMLAAMLSGLAMYWMWAAPKSTTVDHGKPQAADLSVSLKGTKSVGPGK